MLRFACIVVCSFGIVGIAYAQPPPPVPPPPPDGTTRPPDGTTPPSDGATTPPDAAAPPTDTAPPQPAPAIAVQTQPPPPPEPEPSDEEREALANYEPSSVALGGFVQAQYRKRQDSDVAGDTDGFRLARARLSATARTRAGNLDLAAAVEGDLTPDFRMLDAYGSLSRYWKRSNSQLSLQIGQMRVPISRQQLISEANLAFVDKAQLASLVPERDLGMQVSGSFAGLVRFTGGAFNGEGENQIENVNQRYLWAGRIELSPLGKSVLVESGFGGKFVTLGFSFGQNRIADGPRRDEIGYLGIDLAASYKGFSTALEYLRAKTAVEFTDDPMTSTSFKANGFAVQASYLLPKRLPPYRQTRVELGARIEEIDRNDTQPIIEPGDAEQSVRAFTAVASFYLRAHAIKAQLAYTKFVELEDRTVFDEEATYDNDQLLLQLTYQLE